MKWIRLFGFILALFAGLLTVYASLGTTATQTPVLFEAVMDHYASETNAKNAVASIYLNYRIFDTIFEALMLLVSVMGVIHFSRHEHEVPLVLEKADEKKQKAPVNTIALVIPIIMMLGLYLIVNGHNTPGGGFQGGAALSAVLICVYLIKPEKFIRFHAYEKLEKLLFLTLCAIAVVFATSNLYLHLPEYNVGYLIVMNFLIGIKVFCGLSIVFYRFVHYEDS